MIEESKNKKSKTKTLLNVLRVFNVRKKKKKSLVWLNVLLSNQDDYDYENKFRRR